MSSSLGVQQWFRDPAGELSRHAREFGFTFVGDDDEEDVRKHGDDASGSECDEVGAGAGSVGGGGRYGGVIMVKNGGRAAAEAGGEEDEKLLRLLGGGAVADEVSASDDDDEDDSDADDRVPAPPCSVVLDPLPNEVLRSLSCEGRVSAARATTEVHGLLQELVAAVAIDADGGAVETAPPPPPVVPKTSSSRRDSRRRSSGSNNSRGHGKRRKRSTSCSTTSSACSGGSSHRKRRHHKHRHRQRRRSPTPTPIPRVNPIFVWIKQDDTRIVEVLCEDYDKRNRIRLTKTAQGWRAIPRTERLSSAGATALSPPPPALASNTPLSFTTPDAPSSESARCETPPVTEQPSIAELPADGSASDHNSVTSPAPEVDHSTLRDESAAYDEAKEGEEEEAEGDEEREEEEVEHRLEEEEEDRDCEMEYEDEENEGPIVNSALMYESPDNDAVEKLHSPKSEVCESECADCPPEPEDEAMAEEEEDLLPTDLSIPKVRKDEDEECKPKRLYIPRTPPISIPTPFPKFSPSSADLPTYPEVKPAHQQRTQNKSMFLESLLSSPRKCHQSPRPAVEAIKGPAPLDLGPSSARSAGSPTVSCSDENRTVSTASPPKRCEDITLKNLLSRHPASIETDKAGQLQQQETVESSSRKSRLLELLTSEPPDPPDAFTQLRKVLSDPEIVVPDPLLVPRDRLADLLSSPAREIPRLLALRPELRLPEALAYPALLRDPDILVVSLAHLTAAIQSQRKTNTIDEFATLGAYVQYQQRYQSQQQAADLMMDVQLKSTPSPANPTPPQPPPPPPPPQQQQQQSTQQQNDIDAAAAAAAINQMLWLPYLNQLEAAALACGNNQEFLSMLNAVFSPHQHQPPPPPYPFLAAMSPGNFGLSPMDYKTQVEFQQAIALWQEAMLQAANNNNGKAKPVPPQKNGRFPHVARKTNNSSARTSPIAPNFQQQTAQGRGGYNNGSYPTTSQLHHQYNVQRCRQNATGLSQKPDLHPETKAKPSVTCKSLLNLLSSPRRHQESAPVALKVPQMRPTQHHQQQHQNHKPPMSRDQTEENKPIDLSPVTTPKLKVKQHLIDPLHTPRLLKEELHQTLPDNLVVSSTAASPGAEKQTSPHLWHPLFGRLVSNSSLKYICFCLLTIITVKLIHCHQLNHI